MTDVFISYSKHDRPIAQALADDLVSLGITVWWDFELYAGDDFHDAILAAIDAATAVIVIWSSTARASKWVRSEATRANRQNKLIPTLAPGATLDDVPLPFDQLQCVPILEREQIYRSLQRLRIIPAPEPDQPQRPPFKLPASRQELEEDISGYLTLIAEAIPKKIIDIDAIADTMEAVLNGSRKQRTARQVSAMAAIQTLARTPNIDRETRLHIEDFVKVIYHIDTDQPPPKRSSKPIIKRPLHAARQTPAHADFRDLVDIAALGDAIDERPAKAMFARFKAGAFTKASDIHPDLKELFDESRTRYRLNKHFKKSLDEYLNTFERDFIHRNHEGHRISDFLTTARLGKAYLFLVQVARRRPDFSQR
jgi:hypothetical protein